MDNQTPEIKTNKNWLITAICLLFLLLIIQTVYWMGINGSLGLKIRGLQDEISALNKKVDEQNKLITAGQTTGKTVDQILYTNGDYGFTVKLPAAWKGYKVAKRLIDWGAIGTTPSYDFGFSSQDSLFNISVFTLSQWSNLGASDVSEKPAQIGKNSKYVFAYSLSQYSANATMDARRNEAQQIISTFSVK